MLFEAGQAVAEAAKQGSITVAIPTAVITSVLTGVAVKLPDIIAKMKGKPRNGNGPKPGTAEICQKRGERISIIETRLENMAEDVRETRSDVKTLLGRVK